MQVSKFAVLSLKLHHFEETLVRQSNITSGGNDIRLTGLHINPQQILTWLLTLSLDLEV